MLENHAWEIFGTVLSILLSVNVFFVYRLFKNIDSSISLANEAASKMSLMEAELLHVKEKVDEFTNMWTRLTAVEKQLAVIEYVMKQSPEKR